MKVLIVTGKINPPLVEGTQKSVLNLCNGLTHRGHEVTWFTKSLSGRPERLNDVIDVVERPMDTKNILGNRSFTKKFDIVNVHSSSTDMALYWKLVSSSKLLVTWPAYRGWRQRRDVWIQRLTTNSATTGTVSKRLKGKAQITPYGVETRNYELDRLPGSDHKLKILFIGRPNKRRGFDHLCNILKELDFDFELRYAVADSRGDPEKALKKLRDHGIEDSTEVYKGYVRDLPEYINESDIFLNLIENSYAITSPPILTLEAMSCSRACICSRIEEFENIIEDGKNGFIRDFDDYKGIAELLERLNQNREQIPEIGEEARKTIEEKHSISVSVDSFENAYRELIK